MQRNLGRNSKLIKIHNRGLVLRKILQNPMISRKEIAERTGLTQAAITKIVNNLIERGLVVEKEMNNQNRATGRQPIGLCMNSSWYRIASVEVGRYRISTALCDLSGNIISRSESTEGISKKDIHQLPDIIIKLLEELFSGSNTSAGQILGIGISAPGPINNRTGVLHGDPEEGDEGSEKRFEVPYDWRRVPLKKALEDYLSVPVFADNSGNISALAESWFGEGREIQNFAQYTVGMGIGAGVIIDGLLYRGEDDVVSEIGHITVDMNGPVCSCGNIGCLEIYGSFMNLISEYRLKTNKPLDDLNSISNQEAIKELEMIWDEAQKGDEDALGVIEKLSRVLGIGAVSLTNIFSPEFIIVSTNDVGKINVAMLTDHIQEYVRRYAFSVVAERVKVIPSKFGNDIHMFGAAALVLQELFSLEHFFQETGRIK